jgi:hypothetical protein
VQFWQLVSAVTPVVVEYVPAGQLVQLVDAAAPVAVR